MRLSVFAALAVLVSAARAAEDPADLIVETSLGRILGSAMSSVTGRPFLAFRGVPYAEPPQRFKVLHRWPWVFLDTSGFETKNSTWIWLLWIGLLQQDPEPVKPWSDRFLFDGTAEGPFCTQLNMMMQIVGQEDCLALNVYTHQVSDNYLTIRHHSQYMKCFTIFTHKDKNRKSPSRDGVDSRRRLPIW